VIGLSNVDAVRQFLSQFEVDDLVIEDIFNVQQRNKLETHESYLFGAFKTYELVDNTMNESYISLILFKDVFMSFHESEPIFLKGLTSRLENISFKEETADLVFYHLMDVITDKHLLIHDSIEQQFNLVEEEILEYKKADQEMIYQVRKHLLKLSAVVTPLYDQLTKTLKEPNDLFNTRYETLYFDLFDHLKRLDDKINQSKELMRHLLDLQMNNQSNRMNKIMGALTVFSAMFIPATFITGFFGMNFVNFDFLKHDYGVFIVPGACFAN
jgi:magnesium transporter